MALTDHARGYLITLTGVAILPPDTLLIRLAAIEPFTLAAARGVMGGMMVLALSALWYRRGFVAQLRGLVFWALVVALLQGVGMVLFVVALDYTSAANVQVVFATTPLIAAAMTWAFFGDRIPMVTLVAILISMVGLIVVASGSLGAGHAFGDLLALLDAASMAAFYVVTRHHREVDMIPAMGLGLLITAALALPVATIPLIAPLQWLWIALGGLVVVPFASMLLTVGPRYLAAPGVAVLLLLLETVVGPFWVWLVLAEQPGIRTLIGGQSLSPSCFCMRWCVFGLTSVPVERCGPAPIGPALWRCASRSHLPGGRSDRCRSPQPRWPWPAPTGQGGAAREPSVARQEQAA
jgi:drug/metabolite transporter (DMT)-like permease